MKAPHTPTGSGVALKFDLKGPRTPSANRLASQQQQALNRERGEPAAVAAPFAHSTRAWRTGGDRKIMFENRGRHALVPEVTRPVSLVALLTICAWLLLVTGVFQVVVSKLSEFKWPLHWVGVLMMFLGLMTMGVRIYANRCGTKPRWVGIVAFVTLAACLAAWLAADGPLYEEVKPAEDCNGRVEGVCPGYDCVCRVDGVFDLCVDFGADCKHVPNNRRYLLMSIISLWVGIGLSFVVGVGAARIVMTTFDEGAVAKAEEKQKMKEKQIAMAKEPPAAPFGV